MTRLTARRGFALRAKGCVEGLCSLALKGKVSPVEPLRGRVQRVQKVQKGRYRLRR